MNIPNQLQLTYTRVQDLKDPENKTREFGKKQIAKIIELIEVCGFCVPVIIDQDGRIIVGLAFVEAARRMGIDEVPAVRLDHLDNTQARVLRLAYARIMEEEGWVHEALAEELGALRIAVPDLDLTLTGFEIPEIDLILDNVIDGGDEEDIPAFEGPSVTRDGDLWRLDKHLLYCGDSCDQASYKTLLGEEKVRMTFWDPPYNVPIKGHVSGLGEIKHDDFIMGVGEMTEEQFMLFLHAIFLFIAQCSVSGSIHFVCMDWRHTIELQIAARRAEFDIKNMCVWVKDNGGMGSFYRSRHELIFVFKLGKDPHVNNIQLGKYGRNRTNVWEFQGANTMRKGRLADLAMHPTVKPVAMVVEAIKDCSGIGDIVCDPFGGSGTTLIAAEKANRVARLIEIDPRYCDVTIRRWQELTGHKAVHALTGEEFNARAATITQPRAGDQK